MTESETQGDLYEEEPAQGGENAASQAPPTATATAEPEPPLFTDEEIRQFGEDDKQAGSVIGKMLALFFLYTVIIMAWVGWKTFVISGS